MSFAQELKDRRCAAGLSQRSLAARCGVSQGKISAYETGRLQPEPETQRRLIRAARHLPSVVLGAQRDEVKRLAAEHRLGYPRVFGSVAEGTDTLSSDIDLLVTTEPGATLLDLVGFKLDVESLTGYEVDVISDGALPDDSPILEQAQWL